MENGRKLNLSRIVFSLFSIDYQAMRGHQKKSIKKKKNFILSHDSLLNTLRYLAQCTYSYSRLFEIRRYTESS